MKQLIEENLTEYTNALVSAGCQSKTVRRLAEFGAILLTVATIAEVALDITFSRKDIIDFLVDQQISTDANTDIGLRAYNALRGFVNANIGRFITNGSSVWHSSAKCLGKIEYLKGGGMEVNIISTEFPEIMKELKFNNPNLILKKFKAAGYLDCEANKNYRKRQITKSDKSVHVIVVRFP